MTNKLCREAFEKVMDEDIKWLIENSPKTLERDHIELSLRYLRGNQPEIK
jgi:hypothetical protein